MVPSTEMEAEWIPKHRQAQLPTLSVVPVPLHWGLYPGDCVLGTHAYK